MKILEGKAVTYLEYTEDPDATEEQLCSIHYGRPMKKSPGVFVELGMGSVSMRNLLDGKFIGKAPISVAIVLTENNTLISVPFSELEFVDSIALRAL